MRRPACKQGFTLIEVLVATVILALGLIGALTAFSLATRATGASRNDTLLPMLAEQAFSQVKCLPSGLFPNAEGRDDLKPGTYEGDFGEDYPGYSWTMRISDQDDNHVVTVDLVIHSKEMGHTRDVAFSTRLF